MIAITVFCAAVHHTARAIGLLTVLTLSAIDPPTPVLGYDWTDGTD